MTKTQRNIVSLIASALTNNKAKVSPDFLNNEVLEIISKHHIENIIYYGALNSNIPEQSEGMLTLSKNVFRWLMIGEIQTHEISEICKAFEENGIDYMPVKGTLLKSWYPSPDMRFMTDTDILIKVEQYDRIKPIVEKLGYVEGAESLCELIWDKPGRLHLELHKSLVPPNVEDYYARFGTGWDKAVATDKKNRFALSDEDHFVYVFTHFARHYRGGGIGIKHLVDVWVYLKNRPKMDFEYIVSELDHIGLKKFYFNVLETLDAWFNGKPDTEMSDFITSVIFGSGAFGTHRAALLSNAVKLSKNSGNAKVSKLIWLVFLPYNLMCLKYPVLRKHPYLLPIMWCVRWGSAIFYKQDKITLNFEEVSSLDVKDIKEYKQALEYVGLNFN